MTLSTHSTLTDQALIDLEKEGGIAICPMVAFRQPSVIDHKRASRVGLRYGEACGSRPAQPIVGQPVCFDFPQNELESWYEDQHLFVGLGNSYLAGQADAQFDNSCDVTTTSCVTNSPQTCNSRAGNDLLPRGAIQPPTACDGKGTDNFVRWYEIPLPELAAATAPPFVLQVQSFSSPPTHVSWVDVLVFSGIKTPDFACPTGIDVLFKGIDPRIGKVERFRIDGDALTQRWVFR